MTMDDIVPGLLESIQKQFDEQSINSAKLKKILGLLKSKKASYIDVHEFAIEIGNILASVLDANITAEILPDGKMYFNIADRILNSTLKKNHELISGFAVDVQTLLNKQAGLGLKGMAPELNQDRVDGLVNRVSSAESFSDIKWILDDPIINFSQSIVDDSIKKNAEFHAKAGLRPKIIRSVHGDACDWCRRLAGAYDYQSAPSDVYHRHQRCRCIVDYRPGDGRRQNVWSKAWRDPKKDAKLKARKNFGLKQPDVQLPKSVSAKAKDIFVRKDFGVRRHPLDDDVSFKIKPGSTIKSVEVIGGKGVKRQIDDVARLVRENPGSSAKDWQKLKGFAELQDLNGNHLGRYEVHWYQNQNVGKIEFKIKVR